MDFGNLRPDGVPTPLDFQKNQDHPSKNSVAVFECPKGKKEEGTYFIEDC
jgi:hypothetical protein